MNLIIGTLCLERGHRLLHNDRDFDPMAKPLRLLVACAATALRR